MSGSEPQAAVVAYRRVGDAVEVCLIRRLTTTVWGIPKGLVDPGDTLEETALNEAWEEAGLKGRLSARRSAPTSTRSGTPGSP